MLEVSTTIFKVSSFCWQSAQSNFQWSIFSDTTGLLLNYSTEYRLDWEIAVFDDECEICQTYYVLLLSYISFLFSVVYLKAGR